MMDAMREYNLWLSNFAQDEKLVAELTAIASAPKEIEDRFYTDLGFGTAGMRGLLGYGPNRMNIYTVRRATAGLADWLLKTAAGATPAVVIAYDSRHMSAEFARETALVLAARGVKALLFDALRPVPILSFAVRHLRANAGVAITASHNPPQYNGYKVYGPDGAQLSPEDAQAVTQRIRALHFEVCVPWGERQALERGLLQVIGRQEVDDAYLQMVLGLRVRPDVVARRGGELAIVYTPLHGSGNIPVRRALQQAGFSQVMVVPQQEAPDGDFPTVKAPNPEDPLAFALAIPLAQQVQASAIFATDPDCDRLGVCVRDGQGQFVTLTGNQIGCLLLYHILDSRKQTGALPANGACVKSIVSTELARAICSHFGVTLFDTLTGFKFIGEKIQQFEQAGSHTFLFGFEESFGYLSGAQVRDKDGVNASLLIAEAACVCLDEGITLYDRLQQIYARFGWWDERVLSQTMPGKDGLEDMQNIMRRIRANPPRQIGPFAVQAVRDYLSGQRTALDGQAPAPLDCPPADVLYFELEGGHWLCVRPSGTEPKIKLYAAAHSQDGLQQAQALGAQLMEAAQGLLHRPQSEG